VNLKKFLLDDSALIYEAEYGSTVACCAEQMRTCDALTPSLRLTVHLGS
jgi:hypothetical protein